MGARSEAEPGVGPEDEVRAEPGVAEVVEGGRAWGGAGECQHGWGSWRPTPPAPPPIPPSTLFLSQAATPGAWVPSPRCPPPRPQPSMARSAPRRTRPGRPWP